MHTTREGHEPKGCDYHFATIEDAERAFERDVPGPPLRSLCPTLIDVDEQEGEFIEEFGFLDSVISHLEVRGDVAASAVA